MPKITDHHIQLITQSNDCCLLTFQELKNHFDRNWDLMEFTRDPKRPLYIHPNGTSFANEPPWIAFYSKAWNTPLYRQIVRLLHIHRRGYLERDPRTFSEDKHPLYLRFVNLTHRPELNEFVENMKGFCITPNQNEAKRLKERYRKAVGADTREFLFSFEGKRLDQEMEDTWAIRQINLDFLWEKKEWLKELIESYKDESMNLRQLAVINRAMEEIVEVLIDQNDFSLAKIAESVKFEELPDTRSSDDVLGGKKISDLRGLLPAHRIYGHFSLCCLEFFLAMKRKKSIDRCVNCGEYYERHHGNRAFCSTECEKGGSAKRSKNYRKRKKSGKN
ncbi:MAG: hypothetical protein WAU31_04575 [Candidatus Moraniibacteriota bacterium]